MRASEEGLCGELLLLFLLCVGNGGLIYTTNLFFLQGRHCCLQFRYWGTDVQSLNNLFNLVAEPGAESGCDRLSNGYISPSCKPTSEEHPTEAHLWLSQCGGPCVCQYCHFTTARFTPEVPRCPTGQTRMAVFLLPRPWQCSLTSLQAQLTVHPALFAWPPPDPAFLPPLCCLTALQIPRHPSCLAAAPPITFGSHKAKQGITALPQSTVPSGGRGRA